LLLALTKPLQSSKQVHCNTGLTLKKYFLYVKYV